MRRNSGMSINCRASARTSCSLCSCSFLFLCFLHVGQVPRAPGQGAEEEARRELQGRRWPHAAPPRRSSRFCRLLQEAPRGKGRPQRAGHGCAADAPGPGGCPHLEHHEAYDRRMNSFEQVNRLDDCSLAVRPDLGAFREVRRVLEEAGGVRCGAWGEDPAIRPDGSIGGGPASALRAYEPGEAGSNTPAGLLRTGKYDLVKYEDGLLVEAEYDPKTGLAV
ncbi:unnamed protein product [Prorocentrum cordatum]|uniref:Uncharacterized protein n=1 Tax=Prorocentrum cordatum TaxID=2364126 RepID=A0ABN9X9N8_9DINO|nr:unnamed protein product [Polarella glacialis]